MSQTRIAEYLVGRKRKVSLLERMWADPLVQCYNNKEKPSGEKERQLGSVFLAGPTSRTQSLDHHWRCHAVSYLREAGFKGYIYVPEPRGQGDPGDFTERGSIYSWESSRLLGATLPFFWIPRDTGELFGLNTNLELGIILGQILAGRRDGRWVFVGWPKEAVRVGLPNHYTSVLAGCTVHSSLVYLCYSVMGKSPP